MANILFVIYPYGGPVNASFYLAKSLQDRGHSITYLGTKDLQDQIVKEGFGFYNMELQFNLTMPSLRMLGYYLLNRKSLTTQFKIRNLFFQQEFKKVVGFFKPDFAVLDADIIQYAWGLHHYNIPFVLLTTTLSNDKAPNVPPYFSNYIPEDNWRSHLKVEWMWTKWLWKRRLYLWAQKKILKGNNDNALLLFRKSTRSLRSSIDDKRAWAIGFKNVPEIFLYPIEFDLGRKSKHNKHYIGACIYEDRKEKDTIPLDQKIFDRELIYCCLGSIPHLFKKDYITFVKKVITFFERHPQYNLILSIGKGLDINSFGLFPKNVYMYNYVPQLEVLKKSRLMIALGGLNSIKESLSLGCPVLVYPMNHYSDQHGVAARVQYYKIGLRGSFETDTAEDIENKCLAILNDRIYKENVIQLQRLFNSYKNKESECLDMIESLLNRDKIR